MLVICEDCAKKYNIDEKRIKGDRARFPCQECGHMIVVEKPKAASNQEPPASELPADPKKDPPNGSSAAEETDQSTKQPSEGKKQPADKSAPETRDNQAERKKTGRGIALSLYLILALMVGFVSVGAAFAYLYFSYIPQLMNEQVNLRTRAVSTMFAGAVEQPLLVRNYLKVNQVTERISSLPGIAYASVVNKKGVVVAGFFQDMDRFEADFAIQVKRKGFPSEIVKKNPIKTGGSRMVRFSIGGQKLLDMGVGLKGSGGSVHVGVFLSDIEEQINKALLSPLALTLSGGLFFGGMIVFLLIARSISKPLVELTDVVNRISLGELDLTIEAKGPREIRELAAAFERMRFSIKSALKRLQSSRP